MTGNGRELESISSPYYERVFLYKSKLSSFSLITFGFAIFWHQNIGEKVVHKMLMKLTPGITWCQFHQHSSNRHVIWTIWPSSNVNIWKTNKFKIYDKMMRFFKNNKASLYKFILSILSLREPHSERRSEGDRQTEKATDLD